MKEKIWFIADTHFRHNNILNLESRPFSSIEEMEWKMIEAWNGVVGENDDVYFVGDFCFKGHSAWSEIIDQLNGNIILVKGNHDDSKIAEKLFFDQKIFNYHEVGTIVKEENFTMNLSHYPMLIGETRVRNFNIHGHIHSEPSPAINCINVGVDSSFMKKYYEDEQVAFGTPVSMDYLWFELETVNRKLLQNKIEQLKGD